jgi:hypothetical protein
LSLSAAGALQRNPIRGKWSFDLNAGTSGNLKKPLVEAPELAGTVPQVAGSSALAEYAVLGGEDQRKRDGSAKASWRRVRRKAPERVEPEIGIGTMSQLDLVPEAEAIESLPIEGPHLRFPIADRLGAILLLNSRAISAGNGSFTPLHGKRPHNVRTDSYLCSTGLGSIIFVAGHSSCRRKAKMTEQRPKG